MGEPPVHVGADQLTTTWPLPAVNSTLYGAPGTVEGVADELGVDAAEFPTELVATTVKV
jgi:hypothetical protein